MAGSYLFTRCLHIFGWRAQAPKENRRRAPRFACCLSGCYNLVANIKGDPWPVTVRNLSVEGIGMVTAREMEPGTRLLITLANESRQISRTLPLQVVYCLPHPNSADWIVGGSFTRKLSGTELQDLLS